MNNIEKKNKKNKITGLKKKDIINAINNSYGIIKTIADKLNLTYKNAKKLITSNQYYSELFEIERERSIDEAEENLINLFKSENEYIRFQVSKYILDKRGAPRGYGELKNENNHNIILTNEKIQRISAIFSSKSHKSTIQKEIAEDIKLSKSKESEIIDEN